VQCRSARGGASPQPDPALPGAAAKSFPGLPAYGIEPIVAAMTLPDQPVTLSVAQIAELNQKLSTMRHDINNSLALVLAGVELMKIKPDSAPRMLTTIGEQPARITGLMKHFSAEFEQSLGITRPQKVH
jgi:hypothetical protein